MMGIYFIVCVFFGVCFGGGFYVYDMVERSVGFIWMDCDFDIQVKYRIRYIINNICVVI